MFETVTVEAALKKGKRSITTPSMIMLLGLLIVTVYLAVSQIIPLVFLTIAIPLCILLPWLFWSFKIVIWRLWAFENVRNVHELKKRAIQEKLIYKDGSWYNKTEIWSQNQKEKWNVLTQKFNIPDIFIDDFTVPEETAIYYSRPKIYTQLTFTTLGLIAGIIVITIGQNILGLLLTAVTGWITYKRFKDLRNRNPQIILNDKGIETAATPFKDWNTIENEEVIVEASGKSSTCYLIYDYPGGKEKLNINDFNTNRKALNKLLRIYRGRNGQSSKSSFKKDFLTTFDQFLADLSDEDSKNGYGKCYFKLIDGVECQGWIFEIFETTFEYHDSGPLAKKEPYFLNISDIDTNTFSYWDNEIKKWTEYFVPDKIENRNRTKLSSD